MFSFATGAGRSKRVSRGAGMVPLVNELLNSHARRHVADVDGSIRRHGDGMGPNELTVVVAEASERLDDSPLPIELEYPGSLWRVHVAPIHDVE